MKTIEEKANDIFEKAAIPSLKIILQNCKDSLLDKIEAEKKELQSKLGELEKDKEAVNNHN